MMLFVLYLFIGCTFGDEVTKDIGDSAWDEIIDQTIDTVRSKIVSLNMDTVPVPNIEKHIPNYILGFITSYTTVITQGATLEHITSISRKGPVTVLQDDATGNITISTTLGLDNTFFYCPKLYLQLIGIKVAGTLSATCGANELEISLSLIADKQNNCKAYFNWARITKLEDFSITITPARLANLIAQRIFDYTNVLFKNGYSSKIRELINPYLAEKLNAAVSNVDLCNHLPIFFN
ncbi:uncharacterized protein [Rhodnius prolixus]|uniref:uncharacterized protein n=1 Tax=Rhodnius prolixus TaxID=13249 RepID=UPI003D18B83A